MTLAEVIDLPIPDRPGLVVVPQPSTGAEGRIHTFTGPDVMGQLMRFSDLEDASRERFPVDEDRIEFEATTAYVSQDFLYRNLTKLVVAEAVAEERRNFEQLTILSGHLAINKMIRS